MSLIEIKKMNLYQNKVAHYSEALEKINAKYNTISILRLLSVFLCLFFMYYYIKNSDETYLVSAFVTFVGFIFLMRMHCPFVFPEAIDFGTFDHQPERDFLSKTRKNSV